MIEKFPGMEEYIEKILKDLKGLNLREMNERISNLFRLTETLATKEVVKELQDDLKELKMQVDKNTFDI